MLIPLHVSSLLRGILPVDDTTLMYGGFMLWLSSWHPVIPAFSEEFRVEVGQVVPYTTDEQPGECGGVLM